MTDTERPGEAANPADAELADAMDSIQSTGEDWRSRERGTETDQNETPENETTDEEIDNG